MFTHAVAPPEVPQQRHQGVVWGMGSRLAGPSEGSPAVLQHSMTAPAPCFELAGWLPESPDSNPSTSYSCRAAFPEPCSTAFAPAQTVTSASVDLGYKPTSRSDRSRAAWWLPTDAHIWLNRGHLVWDSGLSALHRAGPWCGAGRYISSALLAFHHMQAALSLPAIELQHPSFTTECVTED